ncbi:MAG: hypothetical protein R3B13_16445 [Polyangiaceae bacterium]
MGRVRHWVVIGWLGGTMVGCGGDDTCDSKAAGNNEVAGLGPGSYQLTAKNVVPNHPADAPHAAAYEGAMVRIDLGSHLPFAGDAAFDTTAIVTARYGAPLLYAAHWGDGQIVLTVPPPYYPTEGPEDTRAWEVITLTPDPERTSPARGEADLSHSVSCGDCYAPVKLHADVSVALDDAPAEARLVVGPSRGPEDVLLPWDEIVVRFSEPVQFEAPDSAALTVRQSGETLSSHYYTAPDLIEVVGAAGFSRVHGFLDTWPKAGQSQLDVEVGPTLDLAGNRSGTLQFAAPVADLGAPAAPSELLASQPYTWGAVAFTTDNPLCETSACAELGPFVECGSERIGFARAVTVPGGVGKLEVRYRVLSYGDTLPTSTSFRLELASPGSHGDVQGPAPTTAFTPLPSPVLGATGATDSLTFTATTFASPGEPTALAIYAGPGDTQPCPSSLPPAAKLAVLIESIGAQ